MVFPWPLFFSTHENWFNRNLMVQTIQINKILVGWFQTTTFGTLLVQISRASECMILIFVCPEYSGFHSGRIYTVGLGKAAARGSKATSWCHQMETFSMLLALCEGNPPVTSGFPSQRPVTWSFDVFFDLHLNKQLNKQSRRWWFEMPSGSLWRHS